MKDKKDILQIMNRIASGKASDDDIREYDQWCCSFQEKDQPVPYSEEVTAGMLKAIRKRIYHTTKMPWLRRGLRVAAAACLVLVLGMGAYVLINRPSAERIAQSQPLQHDVAPGGNKAMLTLANGQTILLDSAQIGQLASQGNSRITKADSGLLTYNSIAAGHSTRAAVQYNTLSVPKGGQYQLILPDGSKVWLNAGSSIRFPTAFAGPVRQVEMTGEAYFEIARNAGKPFIVKKGNVDIHVLGTRFNVMAYDNESDMKITLLEGLVSVANDAAAGSLLLKPGQQAAIGHGGSIKLIKDANVDQVVAWKNNLFWFDNDSIQDVMRSLSRWYNVDIDIEGNIPDKFTGSIPMDLPFSKVFGMLQKTGRVSYKLVGDKNIVVSP